MSTFIPLQTWAGGAIDTSVINIPIGYINTIFNGLAQSTTAYCTSDLNPLTTSYQDVPGVTAGVTTTGANAFGIAIGTICWICTTLGSGSYFQGDLVVDGVSQTANGNILTPTETTFAFNSSTRSWNFALPAGAHTVKLQARKSGATPVGRAVVGHSALTVIVIDLP